MFFSRQQHQTLDRDAYHPHSLKSPFIDIERVPADLDKLPNKVVPFIWFFIRQFKGGFLLCWILLIINGAAYSLMPWFAHQLVSVFETSSREDVWTNLRPVIEQFFFWMILVDTAAYHAARYVWAHIAWPFRSLSFRQMSLYLQNHPVSYFQNDFAGRLANKITDTSDSMRHLVREFTTPFTFGLIQFVMALILSFQAAPVFMAIFAAYFAAYCLILYYFVPRIMRASMRTQDSKTHTNGQSVDAITNIYTIKVFARRPHEDARLGERLNDLARKGRWMAFGFNKIYMWFDVITKLMWVAVMGLLVHRIINGDSSLADAALLIPIVIGVSQIIWWMTDIMIVMLEYAGTIKDGINTIVKPVILKDKEDAKPLQVAKGNIALRHVDFAYPGRTVFTDLNLDIPAGQKIGLVGPSGAGKSTLVQLLLRLHDIQSGSIEIDGQGILDVTQDSLRSSIAVIPQNSDLMHRSIRENILYGRLNATEAEIAEAARRAHAHEFILSLQDHMGNTGYDAVVGERGVKLSGGQRQRVAIARAVLKDAPILLLDEATSALDSESEKLIQDSLHDLMQGRTVIAIAHRLSTIAQLDRLIVMDEGRIIEDGTHYELLQRKGLYARLWALQSGGFLGDH